MGKKKLDELGVSAFCESMAMLLRAGIQTDEAVSLLQTEQQSHGPLAEGLRVMLEKTEQGDTLAMAMQESGIFPDYCVKTVDTGEQTGRLEDSLFRLSRYYAARHSTKSKLRGAIVYPVAMLGLIIAVLAVMLVTVLPAFTGVYVNLTGSLNASSYRYVGWAYAFCWIALGVMLVLAVGLAVGLLLWNNGRRETVEKLLYRIPRCAALLRTLGLYRFTAAMETYLASGEMQDEALKKSMELTDCQPVEQVLARCAASMDEGHSFAQAAYDNGLFEPIYGRMLLAGERSGAMETVLERLNRHLEEDFNDRVERLVGIVDPLLSGILMLTVGLALLSVMLPLIGMMNGVA